MKYTENQHVFGVSRFRFGQSSYLVFPQTWRRENYRICWDGYLVTRLLKSTSKGNNPWVLLCSPLHSLLLLPKLLLRSLLYHLYWIDLFSCHDDIYIVRAFVCGVQGMVFDAETKSVLHTEMAKKNLFVKRGEFFIFFPPSSFHLLAPHFECENGNFKKAESGSIWNGYMQQHVEW